MLNIFFLLADKLDHGVWWKLVIIIFCEEQAQTDGIGNEGDHEGDFVCCRLCAFIRRHSSGFEVG